MGPLAWRSVRDRSRQQAGRSQDRHGKIDRPSSTVTPFNETPHDYACKNSKPFKTLAQLGIHSNQEHRDIPQAAKLAEPISTLR